jgi:hypothetical protein
VQKPLWQLCQLFGLESKEFGQFYLSNISNAFQQMDRIKKKNQSAFRVAVMKNASLQSSTQHCREHISVYSIVVRNYCNHFVASFFNQTQNFTCTVVASTLSEYGMFSANPWRLPPL